ncbi:MAG TPA: CAP domain-containing protein [Planctomycetota bacterium]|nr:CAP domain-containing protein [Planctomycetota bacterium]
MQNSKFKIQNERHCVPRALLAFNFAFCILNFAFNASCAEKLTISAGEQAIIDATNAERKKTGLPALKPNALLFKAARQHSADMAKENKMVHELYGKKHTERLDDIGYKWAAARENIAFNQKGGAAVVDAWMHSEKHKENILANDISEIGVGIVNDAKGQPYYTQVFGRSESDMLHIRFTLRNATAKALTLDLGGQPDTLKPGASGTYDVSAATPDASVTLSSGDLKLETTVKTGAKVKAEIKDGAIAVTPDAKK